MIAILCARIAGDQPLGATPSAFGPEYSVERCLKRVRLVADSYGGKEVGHDRDRLTLQFTRCSDAFLAAGIIQQRVADLPAASGTKPAARIGICCEELLKGTNAGQDALEELAARQADMAAPAQVLFCLEEGKRCGLRHGPGHSVDLLPDASLSVGETKLSVYDFHWQDSRGLTPRRLAENVLVPPRQLLVRHQSREFVLDDRQPYLTVGRNLDCHVVSTSRRVSRLHARIERRGNHLAVIDQSANGTYIYQDGYGEILLHKGERVLVGKGKLCFGAPVASAGVDELIFEA